MVDGLWFGRPGWRVGVALGTWHFGAWQTRHFGHFGTSAFAKWPRKLTGATFGVSTALNGGYGWEQG
jgi:hypothetical protein